MINYPLGLVKLDKSFSNNYLCKEKIEIFKTIVKLANQLDYKVLAEGIEQLEQVELLKQTNCNYAQGFYYYYPKEVEEILVLEKSLKP